MTGDLTAAIHIIVVNGVTIFLGSLIIDHHDGYTETGELPALLRTDRGGANNNSIHTVFDHILDDRLFVFMIPLRSSHEQAVAVGLCLFFDSLQDFTEERIIDAADDYTQRL